VSRDASLPGDFRPFGLKEIMFRSFWVGAGSHTLCGLSVRERTVEDAAVAEDALPALATLHLALYLGEGTGVADERVVFLAPAAHMEHLPASTYSQRAAE
jgi:hypothetical protein